MSEAKDRSRQQFGRNAENYVGSPIHAKGASLERLVELISPQSDWTALDIATAAGHTAFAFAPHVRRVVASDLTPEMLVVAERVAGERGLANVDFELADAENLSFEDESFDLVTCRLAPHHFPRPDQFVAEALRVLRSGGKFGMVDNVVPEDKAVADFANSWEAKRDPSHVRCLSVPEWRALFVEAGFVIEHEETALKRMDFEAWADNMDVAKALRVQLWDELMTSPQEARGFLRPEPDAFHLTEALFVLSA